MLSRLSRVMAVAMALFLYPFHGFGMELVSEKISVEDRDFHQRSEKQLHKGEIVNVKLQELEEILKNYLKEDGHYITASADGELKYQCKLANLKSPKISGDMNKPLRDDLRTLLYKPWTDPYYANHLSQKDCTILTILGEAIKEETFSEKEEALEIIKFLLPLSQQETTDSLKERADGAYQNLFYRRHLYELQQLFFRCSIMDKDCSFKTRSNPLLSFKAGVDLKALSLTLSKAQMMHMLTGNDRKILAYLKKDLEINTGVADYLDSYAKRRVLVILNDIISSLDSYDVSSLNKYRSVFYCLSTTDLTWLQKKDENLKANSLDNLIRELKELLYQIVGRENYLSKFQFYRDRPIWIENHERILDNIQKKSKNAEDLNDLFTELCQLKVSLNGLGNQRDKSTLGATQRNEQFEMGGTIDWSQIPKKVTEVKIKIEEIQLKVLEGLNIPPEDLYEDLTVKCNKRIEARELDFDKKEMWILALDGGGIRGKIAAEILRDLSHQLRYRHSESRISNVFDYIAGTSVGGLIALALNLGDENNDPSVTEDYIATLLDHEQGSTIFPPIGEYRKSAAQVNSYPYEPEPIESFLLANFGFTVLEEMRKPTMVMAHDTMAKKPIGLKSYDDSAKDVKAACGARSTSSAPGYFPGTTLYVEERMTEFVDGGVSANNPGYYALHEFLRLNGETGKQLPKCINVLSIGTGKEKTNREGFSDKAGVAEVIDILSGAIDHAAEAEHKRVITELGSLINQGVNVTYYRLNPSLNEPIELDSATEENIAKLRREVYESILSNESYPVLIDHLSGKATPDRNIFMEINEGKSAYQEDFYPHSPYLNYMKRPQC